MVRLFVGGMNFASDELSLERWFTQKGFKVLGRQVMRDHTTGHHRGFGFIDLEDEPVIRFNADGEAVGLHGERMDGHKVTVRRAHPKKPKEEYVQKPVDRYGDDSVHRYRDELSNRD